MSTRLSALLPTTLVLVAALTFAFAAQAQVVRQIGGASESSATLAELLAQIGPAEHAEGLEVLDAMPASNRSPAYQEVDIKAGDRLVAVNGKLARSLSDFQTAYSSIATGDMVELGLQRGDRRWIASFPKADPTSLPTVRRLQVQGDPADLVILMDLGAILTREDGELRVTTLFPGAPGADHFQVGDVLVSIDDQKGLEPPQVQQAWEELAVGEPVSFSLLRDGETVSFSIDKPKAHGGRRVIRQ